YRAPVQKGLCQSIFSRCRIVPKLESHNSTQGIREWGAPINKRTNGQILFIRSEFASGAFRP
ncbi:MAG: hypothetical protein AAGF46_05545, partial [Pseudomonadota bacterium]